MARLFSKILVALPNDGEEAANIARTGLAIAKAHEAEARILNVITPVLEPSSPAIRFAAADTPIMSVAQVSEPTIQSRKAMIDDILKQYSPEMKADQTVRAGHPAMEIVSESESWGADLIVLGSRDRNWLERVLDPSVSREVVKKASCAVLILPDKSS